MVRLLKQFCRVWLVMAGASSAFAFALLGPINEAYQVSTIGYALGGDLGAPKNWGEEYRRNTPVMYYSFDRNFLDYFGSNGVYAVEQAFAILNSLNKVSSYSSDLSEFPLEATRFNYRAQSLGLFDLKSVTLSELVEQLGLAEPERWVWTLHDRFQPSGTTCPNGTEYLVIKRNFDPAMTSLDQLQYSSYVNGTLYTYQIQEFCTGPDPLAYTYNFPVDPLATTFSAVASVGFTYGSFYTGLTRDDVGGLRYLLRTNNMNIESAGPGTVTITTNLSSTQLLVSSNLTLLVAQSLTNDAVPLVNLNPGLVVAGTTTFVTNVVTSATILVLTNSPYDPAGAPPWVVPVTVLTTNAYVYYRHQFANVITNHYTANGVVTIITTNISTTACDPYWPYGTICTNISTNMVVTNMVQGDYYILPSASNACGYAIVSTQFIQRVYVTNAPLVATNIPGTATNTANEQYSQNTYYSFNQYVYGVHSVVCQSNSVALRQGVEKITFVRRDYDSLLGQFFSPVTNDYTLNAITNNTLVPQRVRRVVTQPDFLFTADDLSPGPNGNPLIWNVWSRNLQWGTTNGGAYPGLAGPGTIEPPTFITFNKVGPIFLNISPNFMDEVSQSLRWIWGSFDGTTNAPVIYPNGTSITNLENQVLIQLSPSTLTNGAVGTAYNVQFQVTGGQAPYSFSLAPGSPGLPPGLSLSATGAISGTPQSGTAGLTFDFVIRMTDAGSRFVDRNYSITIRP